MPHLSIHCLNNCIIVLGYLDSLSLPHFRWNRGHFRWRGLWQSCRVHWPWHVSLLFSFLTILMKCISKWLLQRGIQQDFCNSISFIAMSISFVGVQWQFLSDGVYSVIKGVLKFSGIQLLLDCSINKVIPILYIKVQFLNYREIPLGPIE